MIVWVGLPRFCANLDTDCSIKAFNKYVKNKIDTLNAPHLAPGGDKTKITDVFVDTFNEQTTIFDCATDYQSDGIHLNQQGQNKLGQAIAAKLLDPALPLLP